MNNNKKSNKHFKSIITIIYFYLLIISVFSQNIKQINLGSNVNSKYDEANPIICPSGKFLYFYRANHPENLGGNKGSQDIWFSTLKSDSTWDVAKRLGKPFNKQKYNILFNVTPDNNTFLIGGVYKNWIYRGVGLSYSQRYKKKWSKPKQLKIKNFTRKNNGQFFGAYLSNDRSKLLLYFSEKKNEGNSDIYVSFKKSNNKWSEPLSLGEPINTMSDEFAPFLASDNKTLYFSSNRKGGAGSADIYMSKRLDETWFHWSQPINLGNPINTDKWEAYFSVDAEAKYAYLVSNYNSFGKGDIIKILLNDSLKPEPVALLHGTVVNSQYKKLKNDRVEIFYKELTNGSQIFSTTPDPISSTYTITLPMKSQYLIYANNRYNYFKPLLIDLCFDRKYHEILKDISLIPIKRGLFCDVIIDTTNLFNKPSEIDMVTFDLLSRIIMKNPELKIIIAPNGIRSNINLTKCMFYYKNLLASSGVPIHKIEISFLSKYAQWAKSQMDKLTKDGEPKILFFIF